MARLIDADELKNLAIETLENIKRHPLMSGEERHIICAMKVVGEMIDDAETVDAQPVVHGRWVRNLENCLYNKCSVCGFGHCREDNYCPNCGCKMKDGENVKE